MAAAEARRQDLPPEGGYRPINFKRVPPKAYFGGLAIFGGYLGMTAGAAYLYFLTVKKVHIEEVEMRSARNAIFPLLLAERDREYLKQLRKNRDEEVKLMANVEGWKAGTLYGEPVFKTLLKDKFTGPLIQEYYVHTNPDSLKARVNFSYWT